MKADLVA
jgi:hypothetical protein